MSKPGNSADPKARTKRRRERELPDDGRCRVRHTGCMAYDSKGIVLDESEPSDASPIPPEQSAKRVSFLVDDITNDEKIDKYGVCVRASKARLHGGSVSLCSCSAASGASRLTLA